MVSFKRATNDTTAQEILAIRSLLSTRDKNAILRWNDNLKRASTSNIAPRRGRIAYMQAWLRVTISDLNPAAQEKLGYSHRFWFIHLLKYKLSHVTNSRSTDAQSSVTAVFWCCTKISTCSLSRRLRSGCNPQKETMKQDFCVLQSRPPSCHHSFLPLFLLPALFF